jgi:hypothetical protein
MPPCDPKSISAVRQPPLRSPHAKRPPPGGFVQTGLWEVGSRASRFLSVSKAILYLGLKRMGAAVGRARVRPRTLPASGQVGIAVREAFLRRGCPSTWLRVQIPAPPPFGGMMRCFLSDAGATKRRAPTLTNREWGTRRPANHKAKAAHLKGGRYEGHGKRQRPRPEQRQRQGRRGHIAARGRAGGTPALRRQRRTERRKTPALTNDERKRWS